jgi:hypothetical protein
MSEGSASKPEISLGDDFGDVVVKVNGATIDVSAAGYVVATSPSGVEWRAANDTAAKPTTGFHEVGDEMDDGTIYAGISPDTHQPMYATPLDEVGTFTFNQAAAMANNLEAHGHRDWRVPTKGELNVLFNNRAAIGGFDLTGSRNASYYWCASHDGKWDAWVQRFSDGCQDGNYADDRSALRCVRGGIVWSLISG